MKQANYDLLVSATKDNTKRFQLTGWMMGKIVDAYDGDTCRLAVIIPQTGTTKTVEYFSVRMLGYDAPEMKKDHRPYGQEVKAVFAHLVLGKIVVAHVPDTKKPDPYGRVLAHIYVAQTTSFVCTTKVSLLARLCCCKRPQLLSSKQDYTSFPVRKQTIKTPDTVDVPQDYVPNGNENLAGLTHVNQWMIDHARVKPYDGKSARTGYTKKELEEGISASE